MVIAFSSDSNKGLESLLSDHFGHAPYFVIVEIEGNNIKNVETIENPYAKEHAHGAIQNFLYSKGVNLVVSGGMGENAQSIFKSLGVNVIIGKHGTIKDVLKEIVKDVQIPQDTNAKNLSSLKDKLEMLRKELEELKALLSDIEKELK